MLFIFHAPKQCRKSNTALQLKTERLIAEQD